MAILKKFTHEACLEALTSLLKSEYDLSEFNSKLIYRDGCVYAYYSDIENSEFNDFDFIICLLDTVNSIHGFGKNTETIVGNLWTTNPTPKVTININSTMIDRPQPLAQVCFLSTSTGIEARICNIVAESWGERRIWPFE